jgi:hypothetical protein
VTERDDDPRLPEPLQRDMRRLLGPAPRIPAEIDRALAAAAARRPRWSPWMRPVVQRPWLAATAAAALVLATLFVTRTRGPLAREDFDRNGRVDVLDAFRLARALERGEPVPPAFDLDGDGVIDRRDVDLVAARAVRIHG